MNKDFFKIKVGDKVVIFNEYSPEHNEHIIKIKGVEYSEHWSTETNPKGMHCYGDDLEPEKWGDDYLTQVHEGNFIRIIKEDK